MNSAFSLAPLFRSSVGFDRFNEFFETAARAESAVSYPPYNVEKHGDDDYRIVVAASGLQDGDLDIQVERGVLTIAASRREKPEGAPQYLHQGIAQRAFRLSFRLDDHIEVTGAGLKNGLLNVELVRRVPEAAKPRRITIGGDSLVRQAANTTAAETKAA